VRGPPPASMDDTSMLLALANSCGGRSPFAGPVGRTPSIEPDELHSPDRPRLYWCSPCSSESSPPDQQQRMESPSWRPPPLRVSDSFERLESLLRRSHSAVKRTESVDSVTMLLRTESLETKTDELFVRSDAPKRRTKLRRTESMETIAGSDEAQSRSPTPRPPVPQRALAGAIARKPRGSPDQEVAPSRRTGSRGRPPSNMQQRQSARSRSGARASTANDSAPRGVPDQERGPTKTEAEAASALARRRGLALRRLGVPTGAEKRRTGDARPSRTKVPAAAGSSESHAGAGAAGARSKMSSRAASTAGSSRRSGVQNPSCKPVTMGEWQQAMELRKRREEGIREGTELHEGVTRRLARHSARHVSSEDEDGASWPAADHPQEHRPALPVRLLGVLLNVCWMLLRLPVRVVMALFSDEAPWEPSTPDTPGRPFLYRQLSQSPMGASLALDAVCGVGME
jgi:hypothetical protein